MRSVANVAGTLVVGGGLIGVWLYFILFEEIGTGWTWWGLMGLVLGAGAYATRFADHRTAIAIWVAVGIAAGLSGTAAFYREDPSILAMVFTGIGSALIGHGVSQVVGEEHEEASQGVAVEAIE